MEDDHKAMLKAAGEATDKVLQEALLTMVAAPSHRCNITYASSDHLLWPSTSPPRSEAPYLPALAQTPLHEGGVMKSIRISILIPSHEPFFSYLWAHQ